MPNRPTSVDAYLASFPDDVREVLTEVRRRVRLVLPRADESISYRIPTYKVDGTAIVHFAGWKRHVSLYPTPAQSGDPEFEAEFAPYRGDKGTATYPLSEPIPYDLIEKQVRLLSEQRG